MVNVLKFRDYSFLKRCNNAEYASVGTRVISRISATGLETLGIPEEYFTLYQARQAVLANLVSMSRASVETTKIYWCPLNFFTSLKLRSVSSLGIRPFFVTFVFTTKPK